MRSIIDTLSVIKDAVTAFNKETNRDASVALIGGYAVIFFGVERTTLDVDICFYSPEKDAGSTFSSFLKKYLAARFHIRFIEASKDPSDPLKHDLIIINDAEGEYPRIDILILRYKWELEGLKQAKSISRLSFPIMPLPYLLAMKLRAGGRKDELDVLELLKVTTEEEMEKVKELAKKVGKNSKLQALLKELGKSIPV